MGKLIVIEGLDGSGKGTQTQLLSKRLESMGCDVLAISLPNYADRSSELVKMYLGGELGDKPSDVNAYAASTFYAVDRYASFKKYWAHGFANGRVLLADRYTTSNACHQMTKLPREKWDEYLDWLFDFEYRLLEIPKPDCVIFLEMPVEVSQRLLEKRYSGDTDKKDVHERDVEYLRKCRESAAYACRKLGWRVVHCSENGEVRTRESIADEIFKIASEAIFD